MPKSKNRKDQKKRSRARTQRIKSQQAKAQKDLMEMFRKAQEQQEETNADVVSADEIGDIGEINEDMDLDLDVSEDVVTEETKEQNA